MVARVSFVPWALGYWWKAVILCGFHKSREEMLGVVDSKSIGLGISRGDLLVLFSGCLGRRFLSVNKWMAVRRKVESVFHNFSRKARASLFSCTWAILGIRLVRHLGRNEAHWPIWAYRVLQFLYSEGGPTENVGPGLDSMVDVAFARPGHASGIKSIVSTYRR